MINCRLIRGDCFEIVLDDTDVVVIDPPFELYSPEFIGKLEDCLPDADHYIVFSKFPHTATVQTFFTKLPMVAEFVWHYTDMTSFRAKHMPLIHHETVTIFSRRTELIEMDAIRRPHNVIKPAKFTTRKTRGKEGKPLHWEQDDRGAWPSSVIHQQRSLNGELINESPPTGAKPVDLLMKLLPAYPGRVLDPFMGSGSVGVACGRLKRQYTGVEIDEDYFRIAEPRVMHAFSQGDLFS